MAYVPDRGHWVWLNFSPQTGHEQAGPRPGLVLSPASFNRHSGMCVICPVTNTKRRFRTHVPIPSGDKVTGVVLADHVRSVDFRARRVNYIGTAPPDLIDRATEIVISLIDPV